MLVLAAGGSRRLGRPKQLVRIGGSSLVARAATRALGLAPAWVGVVLGAHASRIAVELRALPVHPIGARRWRQGLSASLRAGLRAAPAGATHVLVMTVDQWRVSTAELRRLLAHAGRVPVAARYGGSLGIPAVFPRHWWSRLARLQGDRGARALLERSDAIGIPLESAAEDLDTPQALSRLRRQHRAKFNVL